MDQLDGLFRRLSDRFDSALAREDERAAGDLARSLAGGRDIRSLIAAGSRLILPTGSTEPVMTLAVDHCTCGYEGRWLVPLSAAELVVGTGRRPEGSRDRLIPVVRRLAHGRPQVEVFGVSDRRTGVLAGAGPDHLQIGTVLGLTTVPVGWVRALRLVHGG